MSPRAARCSLHKLNRLSEQPRHKKMQTGKISRYFEGKFMLMYWGRNFRSACPKEMGGGGGAVRNIILKESNIRFKNILKKKNSIYMPTFRNTLHLDAYEDEADRVLRNVGIQNSDPEE